MIDAVISDDAILLLHPLRKCRRFFRHRAAGVLHRDDLAARELPVLWSAVAPRDRHATDRV